MNAITEKTGIKAAFEQDGTLIVVTDDGAFTIFKSTEQAIPAELAIGEMSTCREIKPGTVMKNKLRSIINEQQELRTN